MNPVSYFHNIPISMSSWKIFKSRYLIPDLPPQIYNFHGSVTFISD